MFPAVRTRTPACPLTLPALPRAARRIGEFNLIPSPGIPLSLF